MYAKQTPITSLAGWRIALAVALWYVVHTTAWAMTVAEATRKNNELQELEIELALAKKRADLAPFKAPPPRLTPNAPKEAKSTPLAAIDGIEVVAIFGTATNPSADFNLNGARMTRKRGESIYGWTVTEITDSSVKLAKAGKSEKDTLRKTLYLTAARSPQITPGRDALGFLPGPLPLPAARPSVPFPTAVKP